MKNLFHGQVPKTHVEAFVVGMAFFLAVAGLLYFNWLIAVSRSVSAY